MTNPTTPNPSRRGCVRLSLEFAGVLLPISQDEHGRDIAPLKPIVEIFGLEWMRQYKKVNNGISRRLGTCVVPMSYAGQQREMVCIRLDRVAAYLNTINPEQVRVQGNEAGADFLEKKQEEWDDLLHAYETQQGMFSEREHRKVSDRSRKIRDFVTVAREKRCTGDTQDRAALGQLMHEMAEELGIPYQRELAV